MIHLSELFDESLFVRMLDDGYVRASTAGDLAIYNYTQAAQFDGVWNDVTLACRGLIADIGGMVRARPFRKFFNLSQLDVIPEGDPAVLEKLDGSLGIGYAVGGATRIATRGSFTSDQAAWASDWLNSHPVHRVWVERVTAQGVTPLFEIIYPDNRIVVNYGERSELVLLACIDQLTGDEIDLSDSWPGAVAAEHALNLDNLASAEKPNAEGFVLRWPNGERAKFKFDEYVRLHKLLTGVNARTIWELLSAGQPLTDLIEVVPDEFHRWVEDTAHSLNADYRRLNDEADRVLERVPPDERRVQAEFIKSATQHPGLVFAKLDGKDVEPMIWRLVKPEAGRAFWSEGADS